MGIKRRVKKKFASKPAPKPAPRQRPGLGGILDRIRPTTPAPAAGGAAAGAIANRIGNALGNLTGSPSAGGAAAGQLSREDLLAQFNSLNKFNSLNNLQPSEPLIPSETYRPPQPSEPAPEGMMYQYQEGRFGKGQYSKGFWKLVPKLKSNSTPEQIAMREKKLAALRNQAGASLIPSPAAQQDPLKQAEQQAQQPVKQTMPIQPTVISPAQQMQDMKSAMYQTEEKPPVDLAAEEAERKRKEEEERLRQQQMQASTGQGV